jgi:hypothetical protein
MTSVVNIDREEDRRDKLGKVRAHVEIWPFHGVFSEIYRRAGWASY